MLKSMTRRTTGRRQQYARPNATTAVSVALQCLSNLHLLLSGCSPRGRKIARDCCSPWTIALYFERSGCCETEPGHPDRHKFDVAFQIIHVSLLEAMVRPRYRVIFFAPHCTNITACVGLHNFSSPLLSPYPAILISVGTFPFARDGMMIPCFADATQVTFSKLVSLLRRSAPTCPYIQPISQLLTKLEEMIVMMNNRGPTLVQNGNGVSQTHQAGPWNQLDADSEALLGHLGSEAAIGDGMAIPAPRLSAD